MSEYKRGDTFIGFVCLHIYAKKDRPIEENVMKTA